MLIYCPLDIRPNFKTGLAVTKAVQYIAHKGHTHECCKS